MKLHEHKEDFKSLITIVANEKHIPESAVERDYYIVLLLKRLEMSEYLEQCVFKGGTSLSKCYPNSIERFSEDIDLTFLAMNMDLSDNQCSKHIKKIESIMSEGFATEPIGSERSNRSKSMYIQFDERPENRIKLETGSSIRPDPYSKKTIKSYIHEYLEANNMFDAIKEFELESVTLNVLNIERTFIDKIMSVKRHAICGSLDRKVRHIYDVTKLYKLDEIKEFLNDTDELKRLLQITKETDSYYLDKRNISLEFNPKEAYGFDNWKHYFSSDVRKTYESLHKNLLYTDEQQNFDDALSTFKELDVLFDGIGE